MILSSELLNLIAKAAPKLATVLASPMARIGLPILGEAVGIPPSLMNCAENYLQNRFSNYPEITNGTLSSIEKEYAFELSAIIHGLSVSVKVSEKTEPVQSAEPISAINA